MSEISKKSKLLLGFDTSERVATVSVSTPTQTIAKLDSELWLKQFDDDAAVGRSTALVSMIQSTLAAANVTAEQIDAIAFCNGPGTFTGLRVGVVAARMLCYAWDLPVIVVDSLQVAAEKLRRSRSLSNGTRIFAVTNAQRRQAFGSQFEVAGDSLKVVVEQSLFERAAIVELLKKGDHVTGSGAAMFAEMIESKTEVGLPDAAAACCDAEGVAAIAHRRLMVEEFDDLLTIEPIYFRPSAAEEVRLAKEATA